jgi:peptide/nickel transport system substrate-binding protein
VSWHDGKPFTAADVVYSFKRMMDPEVASPHAAVMSAVNPAKIKAVDDHTVVFRLDQPMWDFPVQAGSNFASVVPAHVPAAELKHGAVGTGPFTLTKFTPGQELQVKRNAKYWDPAAPGLDAVRQFFVEEPSARVDGLRTGQFNLISQLAPLDTVSLTGAPDVTVHRIDSGRLVTFNMRVDSAPFDDVRVRRALALAVDRGAMNKQVLRDGAALGNDQPISTISPLWGDLPIPARDVAKAKQLLAEAGHPDGIDVTCYTSTILAGMVEMAVLLKEQAADAGIRIKVQQVPAGTYLDQVFGHKQFYAMGYEMRAGDPLLVMPFLTKGAWNVDGYSNPKYDAALQKARTETDEAARATYYKEAQQVLTEDVPMAIPLYHPVIEATSAAVQGYVPTPITLQRDFRSMRIAS